MTEDNITSLLAIYDRYDGDMGAASEMLKGNDFPASLIDALDAAYDKTQEDRALYPLRQRLFKDVGLCPVCGIKTASELDHFLPRAHFKPLAIYARNLIPSCHDCNHIKLAGFGNQSGDELAFIHAYFDSLPDLNFLEAKIDIYQGGLVVTFQVSTNVGLDEDISNRLRNQIKRLELNERYEKEINTFIMSHATAAHREYARGGHAGVSNHLNIQARHEAHELYTNHWRPTLLRALARHDAFVNGGFVDVFRVPQHILDDLFENSD
ncbi:hypothetical protein A7D16_04905 [Xanthomonas nasturtii]|nr:hypothetical protein A7D16_04905 [Xanthomonas nasturtii]